MSLTSFIVNFYDALGIEKNASADEVRKAYKKKILETHPDKLDPNACTRVKQAAGMQFHRIREAFEILGDVEKRKTYDSTLIGGTDPNLISAEARRRVQQRRNWARLHRDEHERHMAELKAHVERNKRELEAVDLKRTREAALVNEMLQEIYRMNPEFAARRQAVLQRKAGREQVEKLKPASRTPIRS